MEAIISNLVSRFEKGALSRRELVQGIAMLAATGGAASTAQAQDAAIKGVKIDHVSIQVSDLPKSIAFYEKMFGLTVMSEDKPNEIVRLGAGKIIVSLHHKSPTGIVDHFAIGVEKFNRDAVTRDLKAIGANPEDNLDAGFHIKDPAGISVQIVGA
ncbi:MAG TPA: VOC family protein [Bryobacteraceae bacterium]|jgi:catechol 2,3-dioxygenase-like lactoylglutathione lyase family enzyme